MTVQDLAVAFTFTEAAIAGVKPDQWADPTPCSEWNVRELVNHTIAVLSTFSHAAAGTEGPNGDPPDFTSDNPARAFREAADRGLAAWPAAVKDTVNIGSEMPGSVALGINLLDTLTHGWDIATATGQNTDLPQGSAAAALAASHHSVPAEARGPDGPGFAPTIEIGPEASPTDALVAYLGRRP